jgi:hypothetical protein
MKFSTFLAVLVVAFGGLFVFANLPGESSKATRRFLVMQLAPVAALVDESRNRSLYGVGANGRPSSTFDALAGDGNVDVGFANCMLSAGPDLDTVGPKFFMLSDHKIVANVVSCFVSANRPGLCQEAGRTKLVAMMEIYLWARQWALKRQAANPASVSDDTDPDDKTWDGPDDRAIFSTLKRLAKDGYISLDDFGWFPRAEIRDALVDVDAERTLCLKAPVATKS